MTPIKQLEKIIETGECNKVCIYCPIRTECGTGIDIVKKAKKKLNQLRGVK